MASKTQSSVKQATAAWRSWATHAAPNASTSSLLMELRQLSGVVAGAEPVDDHHRLVADHPGVVATRQ